MDFRSTKPKPNVSAGICNPSIGEEEAGGSQGHWHGGLAKTMIPKLQTPCLKNKMKSNKKKKSSVTSDLYMNTQRRVYPRIEVDMYIHAHVHAHTHTHAQYTRSTQNEVTLELTVNKLTETKEDKHTHT